MLSLHLWTPEQNINSEDSIIVANPLVWSEIDTGLSQEDFIYWSNSIDFSLTDHVRTTDMREHSKQRAEFNLCYSAEEGYILTWFSLSFVDCQWERGSQSGVFLQAKRYF